MLAGRLLARTNTDKCWEAVGPVRLVMDFAGETATGGKSGGFRHRFQSKMNTTEFRHPARSAGFVTGKSIRPESGRRRGSFGVRLRHASSITSRNRRTCSSLVFCRVLLAGVSFLPTSLAFSSPLAAMNPSTQEKIR